MTERLSVFCGRHFLFIQIFILVVGAAMTAFYGFRASPYVGFLNDDTGYIVHAVGLLKGTYYCLNTPQPKIDQFWPGYPLFLVPFVAWFQPHWEWLRLSSVVLMGLAGGLLLQLTRHYFSSTSRLLLLAIFAFHPSTLKYSSMVISETLFIVLTLSYFLVLEEDLAIPGLKKQIAIILLLAWIVLTRPIGVILYLSTIVVFFKSKRWKEGFLIVLCSQPFWIWYPLWVSVKAHRPVSYVGLWQSGRSLFTQHFFDHLHRVLYFFFCNTLLGVTLPHEGHVLVLSLLLIALSVSVCGIGFVSACRRFPEKRALFYGFAIFIAGDIATHLMYLSLDRRYFWPMLPFLVLFFLFGLRSVSSILHWPRVVTGAFILVWCGLLFTPDIDLMRKSIQNERLPFERFPQYTMAWIKDNIPRDSLCLGRQSFLYAYTGLQGEYVVLANDREEFLYTVYQQNYRYAVLFPVTINMPLTTYVGQGGDQRKNQNIEFMHQWKSVFIPVYQNEQEQTSVLKIEKDAIFERSYAMYLNAIDELSAGHVEAARTTLDRSITLFPSMASSWVAYGILYYTQSDFKSSESALRRALALDPDSILGNEYMARIQTLLHHPQSAVHFYQQSIALINYSGSYSELLPMLHQELSHLE